MAAQARALGDCEAREMVDEPTIDDLLRGLDDDDGNAAEDARLALESHPEAIRPLLSALPTMRRLGKLLAIELLEAWPIEVVLSAKDPSVEDTVLPLLRDEHDTVREWAAGLLGWVGAVAAVPEIERALQRAKEAGVPLDWTEPGGYRRALTVLGARTEVLPDEVAALAQVGAPPMERYWPRGDLTRVIESLSSAGQVVLNVQGWRTDAATRGDPMPFYWTGAPTYGVDVRGDWADVVARSRSAALAAAAAWSDPSATVVTLEWIAETDR